ncbi:MAG: hypothetical protein AAE977_05505 [Thermoplasmataceae archaeon]|jgi:hypothetical protein
MVYTTNIGIMLPSIVALFFVLPFAYSSLDYYIVVPVVLLPFVKRLLPEYLSRFTYNIATIIVLLLVVNYLYSLLYIHIFIISSLILPISSTMIMSFEIGIVAVVIIEGLYAKKSQYTIGAMVGSLAVLLEFVSAVLIIYLPHYSSFASAIDQEYQAAGLAIQTRFQEQFYVAITVEYLALVGLLMNGSVATYKIGGQSVSLSLPLNTISSSVDYLLLGTFIVALLMIVIRYYLGGESDYEVRLDELFYSVIVGSISAIIILALLDLPVFSEYHFTGIMVVVLVLIYVAIHSSREKKSVNSYKS